MLGNETFDGRCRATGTEDVKEVLEQIEVGHGLHLDTPEIPVFYALSLPGNRYTLPQVALHPVRPMLATSAKKLPVGKEWTYEVKWDGYRTLALKEGSRVTLLSRNLKNATAQYPTVARSVAQLGAEAALLDGEIVAVD